MGGSSSTPSKVMPESVQQTQSDKPVQVAQYTGASVERDAESSSTSSVSMTISPVITLVPSATVSAVTTPAATPVADTPVHVESPVVKQEVPEVKEAEKAEKAEEKQEKQETDELQKEQDTQEKQESQHPTTDEQPIAPSDIAKTVQVVPVKVGRKKKAADVVPKKADN